MSNDRKFSAERCASTKVLVVNGDHHLLKLLRHFLTIMGFRNIYQAANGPAGVDIINAKSPDVVILDWEMGSDSQNLIQALRSPDQCSKPDVPIIMLIGLGSRGRALEDVKAGVTKFLVKPVSLQSLRQSVAAVMH